MADVEGRPNWGVLQNMLEDLRKTTREIPNMQRRMLEVTGTAWSSDGLIKAVVGPRGHLLELDIDPRALRQPNSKALSAAILLAVRAAVEDAGRQSSEVLATALPTDLRNNGIGGTDMISYVGSHDSDTRIKKDDDDG